MAITLSITDYDELWQAANPPLEESDHENLGEMREIVPPRLGQGYVQQVQLRGIYLSLFDYHLHEDICLLAAATDRVASYEVGFNLSGNRCGKRTGENFLEWGQRPVEQPLRQMLYANDPVVKVDLHLDPDHEIGQLLAQGIANLSSFSQPADGGTPWLSDINVITPAMRFVLEQIWRCPFHGQTRRIFLEGKCLELIALKLEQLHIEAPQLQSSSPLSADDCDRIYAAQKILIRHLDNPPTLLELARQVHLNDYKLKVGFKQIFGTTVFGYLHQHRMETARHLLHSRRLNVKEVAQAVGYANQSRFAAAFRKQFGINPKAYSRG